MPVRNLPPDRTPVPAGNAPGSINTPPDRDDLYVRAAEAAIPRDAKRPGDPQGGKEEDLGTKMLRLVTAAQTSADRYSSFVRKGWDRTYRAFRNQHFEESKYNSKEWKAKSKHFRPKTRSAVRKFMAGVRASLFSTVDAVSITAGNESDATSRAGAALMQEVINYRTDRTSGRNAIPWFKTAMGATQDATITGIVVSKQYWKLKLKQTGTKPVTQQHPDTGEEMELVETGDDGVERPVTEPIWKAVFDRPDSIIIAPENVIIDSGADWTDPAQSSAFLGISWPMKIDEIRQNENDPSDPWKHLEDSVLTSFRTERDRASTKAQSIRSSREGGTDRMDQTNTSNEFSTVWVTEWFVRSGDEDYTFFALGDQQLLTDPRPVEEVYPWNFGERPIVIGYGAIEAHKIFPMAPAESWQPIQAEINDLANLTLDTVKMNVGPIAKVKRGRQVDLDKLRSRAPYTNLMLTDPTDVEFEKPPGVDAGAWQQLSRLDVDFDTLAGQFDVSSVQTNRSLNETVGGMRMLSGAANTLQEFDQAIFFETWAEPVLGQIVKLCQYYEHDETILGLCGERAQLWENFGVNEITDQLLEAQITCRVDVGNGAGDPQQRIAKFQMATAVAAPLLKDHPKFRSGEWEIDAEAVMQEVYGAAGYRDGGKRFIKKNPPPQGPDPMQELAQEQAKADIEQKRSAANLNLVKAQTEPMDARIRVFELISDLMGQHNEHNARATEINHNQQQQQFDNQHKTKELVARQQSDAAKTHVAREKNAAKPAPKSAGQGAPQRAPAPGAPQQPQLPPANLAALLARIMPHQQALPPRLPIRR